MATNPMQRKARNSFLGGMLVMLVIALVIGGAGYFFLTQMNKIKNPDKGTEQTVYVLSANIRSGEKIDTSMFKTIKLYSGVIPSNAVNMEYIAAIQKAGKSAVAKVDIAANTILTKSVVAAEDDVLSADVRYVEYNMLTIPTTVGVGDYIDVRLALPNGQDFIVVSKKKIISIQGDTIGLNLTEGDILMMNSAIVEAYIIKSSNVYVAPYVEAGIQTAAAVTYTPTKEVQELMQEDSNIVTAAKQALQERFTDVARNGVASEKLNYIDDANANIEEKIKEQIENAKKAREDYLTGLQATTVAQ